MKRRRPLMMRVRGVNRVTAKGRVYYYHRKTGLRLRSAFGTPEFFLELQRLNAPGPAPRASLLPGTWGALVMGYRASPEYARLAPRTRSDYEKVLDWLAPIDGLLLAQLDSAAVMKIRDKAFAQKKRRFANHVLQVMGTVLEWGRPRKLAPAVNPAHGIKKLPRPKDLPRANRPWSDAETTAVLDGAEGGLKLGIALACHAGMRGGDVVRVTWSIYDGQRLEWKQGKTGDEVWLPALPQLKAIMDDAKHVAPTIVTSVYGRPLSEAGLRKAFRTLILRLMREGKVAPGLTLHGCRHTLGDELANLGAEARMIQAVLGHRSLSASLHYSQGADRRRQASAAIELLSSRRNKPIS